MKKLTKKSISLFIGMGCAIGFMSQPTHSVYAATFGGGDGTHLSPYLISEPEHLAELSQEVEKGNDFYGSYFEQTKSINFKDFDDDDNPDNGNFTPIGSTYTSFRGSYDGNYYTIANVQIIPTSSKTNDIGFFTRLDSYANVKNLNFKDLIVHAKSTNVGGVAGFIYETELSQINVSGSIINFSNSTNTYVGGIAGTIRNFSSTTNSLSFQGEVKTNGSYSGGIVGYLSDSKEASNLLSLGIVESISGTAGGLIGYSSSDTKLNNCLSQTEIKGTKKGGVIGSTMSVPSFSNIYWDQTFSETSYGNGYNTGPTYQSGMTGLTTDQLQGETAKTNLVGFDFDNVWETTDGLPRLKWLNKLKSPLIPGTHEVLLAGKVEPTLISLTVPADPINFVINPNLPDEEMFVAPKFQITNATKIPVSLTLHSFEKVTGPFNDVLPTEHDDWFNLETSELFDFALGIQPVSGQGWRSLTEGVRYVADKSNYDLGVLEPKGTVSFKLVAHHGTLFNTSFETTYRLTFIVGV